ncbi:MAG: alpha/beta fold hydrolase [Nannocystaceae bacterium]|nr:alpha/beta fold hydrolase [Nannocystaceae bacterium]
MLQHPPAVPPRRHPLRTLALWLCATFPSLPGCAHEGVHAPPSAPKAAATKTVVLVHGMFMTPACWGPWVDALEQQGFEVLAPAWPAHDRAPADARKAHPDPALAAVDLAQVVDHYRTILRGLDEPPVLIGHSMGGLVVQILLAEGLATAAIAIDAAPPKGVFTFNGKFLKSNGRVLRGSLDEPLDMDPERFAYVFVNAQAPAQQRKIWEQFAQPESRRVGRGATTEQGKVDFGAQRGPLLLVTGELDHAVPPVIGRKTFRRYGRANAYTELREIAGADHWLIGSGKWREVFDLSVTWLRARGVAPTPPASPGAAAP